MTAARFLFVGIFFAAASLGAMAGQQASADDSSNFSARAEGRTQGCSDAAKNRHDHLSERNLYSAVTKPCASTESAAPAAQRSRSRAQPLHDHGKIHKQQ